MTVNETRIEIPDLAPERTERLRGGRTYSFSDGWTVALGSAWRVVLDAFGGGQEYDSGETVVAGIRG